MEGFSMNDVRSDVSSRRPTRAEEANGPALRRGGQGSVDDLMSEALNPDVIPDERRVETAGLTRDPDDPGPSRPRPV